MLCVIMTIQSILIIKTQVIAKMTHRMMLFKVIINVTELKKLLFEHQDRFVFKTNITQGFSMRFFIVIDKLLNIWELPDWFSLTNLTY